jgi:hypothetical protein
MLLRGVREVAAKTSPGQPHNVSERAFDSARATSDEYSDLPAARQIARELGIPWAEVLILAHAPTNEQSKKLARKAQEPMPKDWLTPARIKYALRLIAERLGVDTLSRLAYDAERDMLQAADEADWMHGRRLHLPSASTLSRAAGGWDAALHIAGLEAYVPPRPTVHQVVVSQLEVMDRFYDHYGEQPTHKALRDFARGNKIPMSGEGGRKWSEAVAEWRQSRIDRGLGQPRVVGRRGRRDAQGRPITPPDFGQDVGAAKPGEFLYQGKWHDEELCVGWLARYLATVPTRRTTRFAGSGGPTARTYEAWAAQTPGAPMPKFFIQHGGWSAVLRKAQERVAGRPRRS